MYKAWVHRSYKHLHLLQLYKLGEKWQSGEIALLYYENVLHLHRIECSMVILDKYTQNGHSLNPALLWEYDLRNFDWQASRTLVAQRVVELGCPEDYYAAFDIYGGIDEFRETIKEIPYLSPIDINFVCLTFKLKKEELRCCKHRPLSQEHWNF